MTDPAFSTLPAPAADTLWNDPTCSRRLRVVGIDDTHVTAEVGTTRVGEFVKVRTTRILRRTWAARMDPLAAEEDRCERCKDAPADRTCCSSHGKRLCHRDYRLTHFVEVCVKGCTSCAAEGLPVVMTGSAR